MTPHAFTHGPMDQNTKPVSTSFHVSGFLSVYSENKRDTVMANKAT